MLIISKVHYSGHRVLPELREINNSQVNVWSRSQAGMQEIRGKEVHSQRAFKPNTTSAVAATGQLRCTDADPLQPLTRAFCVGFNIDIYLN